MILLFLLNLLVKKTKYYIYNDGTYLSKRQPSTA